MLIVVRARQLTFDRLITLATHMITSLCGPMTDSPDAKTSITASSRRSFPKRSCGTSYPSNRNLR